MMIFLPNILEHICILKLEKVDSSNVVAVEIVFEDAVDDFMRFFTEFFIELEE